MERTLDPAVKINVEAVKLQLLKQKTSRPRFKFPASETQTIDIMTAAYQAEVEYRRRKFINDDFTMENISKFAKFLTNETSKFGVMFCGVCGNGKTTLVSAFQSVLNYMQDRGFFDNNIGISIIDAKEIANYAKDLKQFNSLRTRKMLAIEDMGREPLEILDYGNVLNPVIDLLEYRYNQQLFTVITTNLTPKEIREKYGNRIADRFNEMFDKIIFSNTTYRTKS